jgi:hypothetical protein
VEDGFFSSIGLDVLLSIDTKKSYFRMVYAYIGGREREKIMFKRKSLYAAHRKIELSEATVFRVGTHQNGLKFSMHL